MSDVSITIQLYTLREQLKADYEGTIRALAEIGFRNVEPAGFPGTTPRDAAALFKELGINAPSCHGPLPVGDQKNEVIETAQIMGHKYLITGVPPQGKDHFSGGADKVKAMADIYCEAAINAAAHGLQVGYHNHDWDVADIDGTPAYRIFLENTPDTVLWEADLFWVARAGVDPVSFIKELGPRGKCLHFKDGIVDPGPEGAAITTAEGELTITAEDPPFTPAGTGQVDLKACAAALTATEYAAVELDNFKGDMLAAVRESYDYLHGLFA